MTTIVLNVGDFAVTAEPVEYVCYGLGSCIALFLYEKGAITAGAHIPVPSARKGAPLPGGDVMLNQMIVQLTDAGYKTESFKAKITGGASIVGSSVGNQNINAVHELLRKHKIDVTSTDVGGRTPRTARFKSTTEMITISTPDKGNYQI